MDSLVNSESCLKPHKVYRGKRVLVTGHTGFKGSWLTQQLLMVGAEVMGYSLPPANPESLFERLGIQGAIRHVLADIRDYESLEREVKLFRPDIVFHLAAQAIVRLGFQAPRSTFETNIMGGVNLLEVIRCCQSVEAVVFVTSDKCYENREWLWGYRESDRLGGLDPYSASKGASELVVSSYLRSFFSGVAPVEIASVRAGNVIGGGDWAPDRIVPDCIRAALDGKPLVLRAPLSTRPWQHVLEPISGYLALGARLFGQKGKYSGAWNFGPPVGEVHTVIDVVNLLASHFDNLQFIIEESDASKHEAHFLQLNSDKARQLLSWNTKWDFKKTIEEVAYWYRAVLLHNENASKVTQDQILRYYEGAL